MGRKIWLFVALALLLGALPAQAVDLKVAGKSALLMDVSTGQVLYESNAHEPLAPASVTKVMTMLLIMEAIDSGRSVGTIWSPHRKPLPPRVAARFS